MKRPRQIPLILAAICMLAPHPLSISAQEPLQKKEFHEMATNLREIDAQLELFTSTQDGAILLGIVRSLRENTSQRELSKNIPRAEAVSRWLLLFSEFDKALVELPSPATARMSVSSEEFPDEEVRRRKVEENNASIAALNKRTLLVNSEPLLLSSYSIFARSYYKSKNPDDIAELRQSIDRALLSDSRRASLNSITATFAGR